jgi:hypothetical protein
MTNSLDLGSNSWWPPSETAALDFVKYSVKFDQKESLAQFDHVSSSSQKFFAGPSAGTKLHIYLSERIANKVPTSVIRLGDADGNVLFSLLGTYPFLTEYCLEKISKIYFGNEKLMYDERQFFGSMVVEAISKADVVGGPERETIEQSFKTPFPDLDVRGMQGMRGVYNYLATEYDARKLARCIWTSTWLSRSLLPHYFELLKGLPFASFITCYPELADLVQERTQIEEVETLLVPMQSSIAYQTKRAPHMGKDIGHYPNAYYKILGNIRPPHQGAVYLVAAGILSKAYCTTIKERGGIAIDIGSTADIWMGTRSRPKMASDVIEKWALTRSAS